MEDNNEVLEQEQDKIDYEKIYDAALKAVKEGRKEEEPKKEEPTWKGFYEGKCEEPESKWVDYMRGCFGKE